MKVLIPLKTITSVEISLNIPIRLKAYLFFKYVIDEVILRLI